MHLHNSPDNKKSTFIGNSFSVKISRLYLYVHEVNNLSPSYSGNLTIDTFDQPLDTRIIEFSMNRLFTYSLAIIQPLVDCPSACLLLIACAFVKYSINMINDTWHKRRSHFRRDG